MLVNIIVGLIILAWVGGAVFYILKRNIRAKKNGSCSCIGCSCGCCGEK